jgi:hypothetical protein
MNSSNYFPFSFSLSHVPLCLRLTPVLLLYTAPTNLYSLGNWIILGAENVKEG